jgi:hypothetical protein
MRELDTFSLHELLVESLRTPSGELPTDLIALAPRLAQPKPLSNQVGARFCTACGRQGAGSFRRRKSTGVHRQDFNRGVRRK